MTEKLSVAVENNVEKKSYKKYILTGILGASALIGVWLINRNSSETKNNQTANQPVKCADSWEMPGIPHPDGNYIDKGVEKLVKVDNNIDPKNVIKDDWLGQIVRDKVLLEHAGEKFSEYGDNKKIDIDPNLLVDEQGCATEVAKTTVKNIEKNIDESKVNYADTPWYFANSFVNTETNTVQYSRVTSENESGRITFKTARTFDILGICGNIAEPRQKPIITIESDDKDEKSDKDDKYKPDKKEDTKPKDPSKDPANNGNANTGSGQNENDGPGTYQSPEQVTKPTL